MSRRLTASLGVVSALAMLAGCGGSTPPALAPPPPKPVTQPAKPTPAVPAPAALATAAAEPAAPAAQKYERKGRRDPFVTLETRGGAGGPTVAAAKLTGIVRGARGLLALVETADGLGYILKPGDTLGDGRLIEIGQDNVVFSIVPKPGSTTNRVVLRLPGD